MKKVYGVICGKYRKFKNPKISFIFGKLSFFFLLFSVITTMKMKKYLKKKNQLRYQKLLG